MNGRMASRSLHDSLGAVPLVACFPLLPFPFCSSGAFASFAVYCLLRRQQARYIHLRFAPVTLKHTTFILLNNSTPLSVPTVAFVPGNSSVGAMAAIDKQQLHQQACPELKEPSIPNWGSLYPKAAPSRSSPELDTEQPSTPMRVSSSNKGSAPLKPQYSEDDETSEELLAAVIQPLERLAAQPPPLQQLASRVQQQSTEQQQDKELQWTAAKQATAVLVACISWVLISSATILINKHIMVDLS